MHDVEDRVRYGFEPTPTKQHHAKRQAKDHADDDRKRHGSERQCRLSPKIENKKVRKSCKRQDSQAAPTGEPTHVGCSENDRHPRQWRQSNRFGCSATRKGPAGGQKVLQAPHRKADCLPTRTRPDPQRLAENFGSAKQLVEHIVGHLKQRQQPLLRPDVQPFGQHLPPEIGGDEQNKAESYPQTAAQQPFVAKERRHRCRAEGY